MAEAAWLQAVAGMNEVPASTLLEFDLTVHSEVEVSRPAAVVWPYLDQLQDWKDSVVSVEHIGGVRGAVGEVFRIGQRPAATTVHVVHKTLATMAPRWKIQHMITEDGLTTDGYLIYALIERDDRTLILCNLAGKVRLPGSDVQQAGGIERLARTANEATQAKLDADHARLKQLIERS
jgi:hypothetical protein